VAAGPRATHIQDRSQVPSLLAVYLSQDDNRAFQALELIDSGAIDLAAGVGPLIGQLKVAQRPQVPQLAAPAALGGEQRDIPSWYTFLYSQAVQYLLMSLDS